MISHAGYKKIHRAFICGFSIFTLNIFTLNIFIYLTGVVDAESILILILSGLVIFVVIVSVVVGGTVCLVLSTAVESVLLDDIEDSLVPQLTASNPNPKAANINFFI
jgi:hypothetical protein